MKLERSRNTVRNIKASLLGNIIQLVGPFAVRTVFIKVLGAEYLGVNSLFTSILSVLSLAELGFGSAVVFNMYSAVAHENEELICALLNFYKKIYRIVGTIILAVGISLIPLLQKMVKGSYPQDINPIIVYLILLANTTISYYLFSYLNAVLNAHQRTDIITKINTIASVCMYLLQIVVLLSVKNYYVYLLVGPLGTISINITTAIVTKKYYPKYKAVGKCSRDLLNDVKRRVEGLLIQRVCEVSRNSFDSIFISMFLGLTEIAIYNNYYYIMNAVSGLVTILTGAILAGVGNSVVTESQDKNYKDMMRISFSYLWISGWCVSCLCALFQHFITIWVGEEFLLPYLSVVFLCLYFYMLKIGDIRSVYVSANGLWWHNRFRALMEAIANISLNYFLGKYFGINGIILATLLSLFVINFCYGTHIVFKHYFTNYHVLDYFKFNAKILVVVFVMCSSTYFICSLVMNTIVGFLIKMEICVFVPNIVFVAIYRKTEIYNDSIPWLLVRLGIHRNSMIWKLLVPNGKTE